MSSDDPSAVQDWADYEKSMIEFLREERRRKLEVAPCEPAPAPPESPPQDPQRAGPAPTRPESSQQDAPAQSVPAPLSGQTCQDDQLGRSAALQSRPDRPPANPASMLSAQPARHRESQLRITLLGLSLVVILAVAATVVLKPHRTSNQVPLAPALQEHLVQKNSGIAINRIDKLADRAGNGSYEILGDRVRLRSIPAVTGSVLRTVPQGTFVRIKERPAESGWCLIQLPGGHEGWMKCDFLKPLPESGSGPAPRH